MFCVSSVFLGIFPLHLFSKVWVNAIYNILLLCFSVFRDVSCCCSHLYESTVELVLGGLEGGGGGTNFRCQGRGIARTLPRGRASKQEEASPSPCLLAGSLHGPSLEEPNRRKTAHRDPPLQHQRAVDLELRDHSLITSTSSHLNIFSVLLNVSRRIICSPLHVSTLLLILGIRWNCLGPGSYQNVPPSVSGILMNNCGIIYIHIIIVHSGFKRNTTKLVPHCCSLPFLTSSGPCLSWFFGASMLEYSWRGPWEASCPLYLSNNLLLCADMRIVCLAENSWIIVLAFPQSQSVIPLSISFQDCKWDMWW